MDYLSKQEDGMVFYHVNRLCNTCICIDAEIGEEFHYILQCKSLINERKLFLSQSFFYAESLL